MELISPVCQESCKPHIGRKFCIVTADGRQIYGTLSGVSERGLEFNGVGPEARVYSAESGKGKKRPSKTNKAKISGFGYRPRGGYGYDGYYGGYGYPGAFALEWAAIALLFLIPFFFI